MHLNIFSFHLTFVVVVLLYLSGRPTTLFETMGKADMWLIRNYWDFDFPRPLLPNFEFIGGFHCKPAKPLPKVTWFLFVVLFSLYIFSRNNPPLLSSNRKMDRMTCQLVPRIFVSASTLWISVSLWNKGTSGRLWEYISYYHPRFLTYNKASDIHYKNKH